MKTRTGKLNEAHQLLVCADYTTLSGKNINITDTALVRRLITEENSEKYMFLLHQECGQILYTDR
jgi:hypothetical protein